MGIMFGIAVGTLLAVAVEELLTIQRGNFRITVSDGEKKKVYQAEDYYYDEHGNLILTTVLGAKVVIKNGSIKIVKLN